MRRLIRTVAAIALTALVLWPLASYIQRAQPPAIPPYADRQDVGRDAYNRWPCASPATESESTLCAQWRATVAAEEAALWTKLGAFASIFGIFGLLASLHFTRRAVKESTAANLSYLKVEQARLVLSVGDHRNENGVIRFSFQATNVGGTACVVVLFSSIWLSSEDEEPVMYMGNYKTVPVGAGETVSLTPFQVTQEGLRKQPFLKGRISFTSALNNEDTMPFLFRVFDAPTSPYAETYIDYLKLRAHRARSAGQHGEDRPMSLLQKLSKLALPGR